MRPFLFGSNVNSYQRLDPHQPPGTMKGLTSVHRGHPHSILRFGGFALVTLVTPREVQVATVTGGRTCQMGFGLETDSNRTAL